MAQSNAGLRLPKRMGFQYVAGAAGIALAISAAIGLGSWGTQSGSAPGRATLSASVPRPVEVPTIVVYLAESEQQAETIRAMEDELDYIWLEIRELRPPREVQIFVANTQAGEDAANQYLADLYYASADQFQLQVQLLDMRH